MRSRKNVADYFSMLVKASPKTQDEIAREAGMESSNIISMINTGRSRLPLSRIPALANALGADPKEMLNIALEAYEPELHAVLASLAPSMLISDSEFFADRSIAGSSTHRHSQIASCAWRLHFDERAKSLDLHLFLASTEHTALKLLPLMLLLLLETIRGR